MCDEKLVQTVTVVGNEGRAHGPGGSSHSYGASHLPDSGREGPWGLSSSSFLVVVRPR